MDSGLDSLSIWSNSARRAVLTGSLFLQVVTPLLVFDVLPLAAHCPLSRVSSWPRSTSDFVVDILVPSSLFFPLNPKFYDGSCVFLCCSQRLTVQISRSFIIWARPQVSATRKRGPHGPVSTTVSVRPSIVAHGHKTTNAGTGTLTLLSRLQVPSAENISPSPAMCFCFYVQQD